MNTYYYLYSVNDCNTGYWNTPFYCSGHLEARHRVRQMLLEQNLTSDKLSGMTLQCVGTFDFSSGIVRPLDVEGGKFLVAILSEILPEKEVE